MKKIQIYFLLKEINPQGKCKGENNPVVPPTKKKVYY